MRTLSDHLTMTGRSSALIGKARKTPGRRDYGADDYARSVRANVRAYWGGTFNFIEFLDAMYVDIYYGFQRAWYDGAADCGISPTELTNEELVRLDSEIMSEVGYITQFGDAIMAGAKASGGKLSPLLKRSEMWANRYEAIRSMARSYACRDSKIKWVMNPAKEHCSSCMRLNGRVYRASTWRRYNIEPKMHSLDCRGFRCGCSFVPTSDPVTPGRPPNIP